MVTTMNHHSQRPFSLTDLLISHFDRGLRILARVPEAGTNRANPADLERETTLTPEERKLSSGLMRVNHAGEVSAQALYYGQMLFTQNPQVIAHLQQAAYEEGDHLRWCAERLTELHSRPSMLDWVWFLSAYLIGVTVGLMDTAKSLGFITATEKQVEAHLLRHLQALPNTDYKSRAIVSQMQYDEIRHGQEALLRGGKELPYFVQQIMAVTAKVMTGTAYWI